MTLGLYEVEGVSYRNKFEAVDAAVRLSRPIHYRQDEDFWRLQTWTVEPGSSLQELYRARAEQLRHKYGYILLSYSGGADSHNVLQSFADAGVHLDEIVCWHNLEATGDRTSGLNSEIFHPGSGAVLRAQAFVAAHPRTRLTLVDITRPVDAVLRADPDVVLTTYMQSAMSWSAPAFGGCWFYEDEKNSARWKELIELGKKVCLLWGYDKTMLFPQDGRYAFRFNDAFAKADRKSILHQSAPVHDECFYWTTDLPQLVIKQCHEVKRRLDALPSFYRDPYKIDLEGGRLHHILAKDRTPVSFEVLNTWLYPSWDRATFSAGKSGSFYLSSVDWWVRNKGGEDTVRRWLKVRRFGFDQLQRLGSQHRRTPVMVTDPHFVD